MQNVLPRVSNLPLRTLWESGGCSRLSTGIRYIHQRSPPLNVHIKIHRRALLCTSLAKACLEGRHTTSTDVAACQLFDRSRGVI